MSANKTPNLNLHSWAKTDAFTMEEFNENWAALDRNAGETREALAVVPRAASGTYKGTGETTLALNLGFTPKFVAILGGITFGFAVTAGQSSGYWPTLMLGTTGGTASGVLANWTVSGGVFTITHGAAANAMNNAGYSYSWIALG